MLRTRRLLLRRWRDADRTPFAAICADPDVMRFIGDGSARSAEEASEAVDRFESAWREDGLGLFAVEHASTGAFLGFAGFAVPTFLPEVLPTVEIGWRFAKGAWGRGYATEAAQAALAFGLEDRGLRDVVSICQVENHASRRVIARLGLIHDRRTVDPSCGRDVDVFTTEAAPPRSGA